MIVIIKSNKNCFKRASCVVIDIEDKNYFSEKNTSIDKIPAILQALKLSFSAPRPSIVGRAFCDVIEDTQETFDWVSSAVKTSLGYLCFIFYQKWTRLLNKRIVSSCDTIQSLATIRTATKYFFSLYLLFLLFRKEI